MQNYTYLQKYPNLKHFLVQKIFFQTIIFSKIVLSILGKELF